MFLRCAAPLMALILVTSCASLQDDRIASLPGSAHDGELGELERIVISLDSPSLSENDRQALVGEFRAKLGELERIEVKETVFSARLEAWSGRFALLNGNRMEGQRRLGRSLSLVPGDIPALVLSIRLQEDMGKRLLAAREALRLYPESGELLLEEALALSGAGRYREAVVSFDASLSLLPAYYRQSYGEARDTAWTLRDMDEGTGVVTRAVSAAPRVSWDQLIEISLEKQGFLDFITGGKLWKSDTTFSALSRDGYIPSPSGSLPLRSSVVSRGELAWYLWRITLSRSGTLDTANRYSSRWSANPRLPSPIPDVIPSSPWFDAALGCVEGEIMNLPDGRNFFPSEPASGSDAVKALNATD